MGTQQLLFEAYSPFSATSAQNYGKLGLRRAKSEPKLDEEETNMVFGGLLEEAFGPRSESMDRLTQLQESLIELPYSHPADTTVMKFERLGVYGPSSDSEEEVEKPMMEVYCSHPPPKYIKTTPRQQSESPFVDSAAPRVVGKPEACGQWSDSMRDATLHRLLIEEWSELNVATHCLPANGESNELASGWTVFRILIPKAHDGWVDCEKAVVDKLRDVTEAEIVIYPVDEIRVVMISAKNAVAAGVAFAVVHKFFLDSMWPSYSPSSWRLTRLLVPAAHAKSLDFWNKLAFISEEVKGCNIDIYLTDNVSVLSPGDLIIEVTAMCEKVHDAIRLIASSLGEYRVDESKISELKDGKGIRQPNRETPACGRKSTGKVSRVKDDRSRKYTHTTSIPLDFVLYIIGEDGENLEAIRLSSPASVIISAPREPDTDHVLIKITGYCGSEVEEAEKAMKDLNRKRGVDQPVLDRIFVSTCGRMWPTEPAFGEVLY